MTTEPAAELKARILEAARQAPAPVRRTVNAFAILAVAATGAILVTGFAAVGGIHWAGRPREFIIGTSLGWIALAALTTWLVLRRRRSMLPAHPLLGWVPIAAIPVLLFAWMLLWNVLWPETLTPCRGRPGFVCLDLSLTMGSVPVLLLAFAFRRGVPVRPVERGFALGALVGSWTAVIIHLGCECTDPSHVAIGHVGPMVLLMLAGAFLGWRLLPPRTVAPRSGSPG